MKSQGIVLIVFGAITLICHGLASSFTTQAKSMDAGLAGVHEVGRRNIPVPPLTGVVSLIAGATILFTGKR